jgi:hypothetical protein
LAILAVLCTAKDRPIHGTETSDRNIRRNAMDTRRAMFKGLFNGFTSCRGEYLEIRARNKYDTEEACTMRASQFLYCSSNIIRMIKSRRI